MQERFESQQTVTERKGKAGDAQLRLVEQREETNALREAVKRQSEFQDKIRALSEQLETSGNRVYTLCEINESTRDVSFL